MLPWKMAQLAVAVAKYCLGLPELCTEETTRRNIGLAGRI
jgi:hypothetical protein